MRGFYHEMQICHCDEARRAKEAIQELHHDILSINIDEPIYKENLRLPRRPLRGLRTMTEEFKTTQPAH